MQNLENVKKSSLNILNFILTFTTLLVKGTKKGTTRRPPPWQRLDVNAVSTAKYSDEVFGTSTTFKFSVFSILAHVLGKSDCNSEKNETMKMHFIQLFFTVVEMFARKWETSRKISFPGYNWTLSFKMIYYIHSCCIIWEPKPIIPLRNSFVFWWFGMSNEPYLLLFPEDLLLIL